MEDDVTIQTRSEKPSLEVAGLRVPAVTIAEAARDIIRCCEASPRGPTPMISTSINGQVISLCARSPSVRTLFASADIIHCDGQPLVMLSGLRKSPRLPERVATTDLYPAVAALAAERGTTFYFLGGTVDVNREAVARSRAMFPGLSIIGCSHGYLSPSAEAEVVAQICSLKPDVLWVGLGVPREQEFCERHRAALAGVGVVKTCGGLFDFLAGTKRRAPGSWQRLGLEWLFRMMLEPRRLFLRYLVTNPHALIVMMRTIR